MLQDGRSAICAESGSDRKLVIIGDSSNKSYKRRIARLIRNRKAEGKVIMPGSIYDEITLDMLRQNCFGYVHGHLVGGTNPALLDAASAKNIVIAHDNRFNREVAGETALYFEDTGDLARIIAEIERDPNSFLSLKEASHSRVTSSYVWVAITEQYNAVFKALCSPTTSPKVTVPEGPRSGARVSVIIVNYNGMPYLEKCVRSVMSQNHANLEVILVDNNSSDGSLEYAREKFPDLVIVANEKNLGYTGGINSGMVNSTAQYIAPLNVDTEVEPNWMSAMVEFMDTHPEAGAVTPKSLLYSNRDKVGVTGLNINITGLGFVRGLNTPDSISPRVPFQVAGISGSSFLIRRGIVEQMGGLNEANFMYYDDVDLSWMVNLMGYKIYCVPQSVVYHEYNLKMTPQKMFWLEYGRLSSIVCYFRFLSFIMLLPALATTEVLITVYCAIRGPRYIWAKLRAWMSVIKNRKAIMARRRQASAALANALLFPASQKIQTEL